MNKSLKLSCHSLEWPSTDTQASRSHKHTTLFHSVDSCVPIIAEFINSETVKSE